MESAVAFGVLNQSVSLFIILVIPKLKLSGIFCKIIIIDKVIAGVVRRSM